MHLQGICKQLPTGSSFSSPCRSELFNQLDPWSHLQGSVHHSRCNKFMSHPQENHLSSQNLVGSCTPLIHPVSAFHSLMTYNNSSASPTSVVVPTSKFQLHRNLVEHCFITALSSYMPKHYSQTSYEQTWKGFQIMRKKVNSCSLLCNFLKQTVQHEENAGLHSELLPPRPI